LGDFNLIIFPARIILIHGGEDESTEILIDRPGGDALYGLQYLQQAGHDGVEWRHTGIGAVVHESHSDQPGGK
jgi:hypothetical protein